MRSSEPLQRLTLGTAQFGLRYGVANVTGQISSAEGRAILDLARSSGMDTLDTAMAYGDSEARLGRLGIGDWKVVTKLAGIPDSLALADVGAWVQRCFQDSLARLGVSQVYGLLLHRPSDALGPRGTELVSALAELRTRGLAARVGVSIYDPAELDALMALGTFDLVQAPVNILDRRLLNTGWLEKLQAMRVEVHARSAFLQGLLLMNQRNRPSRFDRWRVIWSKWDRWLKDSGIDALTACIQFALATSVDKVVIGVDSAAHLAMLTAAAQQNAPDVPADLYSEDVSLLNPSQWPSQ